MKKQQKVTEIQLRWYRRTRLELLTACKTLLRHCEDAMWPVGNQEKRDQVCRDLFAAKKAIANATLTGKNVPK